MELHVLTRGHLNLLSFVQYTRVDRWDISRTASGQMLFMKTGLPLVYTGKNPRIEPARKRS